jgi:hypothetical protein
MEQHQRREGRFAPVDSWPRAAARAVIPRRILARVRRLVPRRPRPASPGDPIVAAASRIDRTELDLCETFVVVVTAPS